MTTKKTITGNIFLFLFLLSISTTLCGQNPNTPMMGWSSWNTFRINISESVIKETADAMIDKGLYDAGYTFVNVDDGFFGGRDASGNIIPHTTRFPNGMKVVADYIHSKGLKAGIYSEAGNNTCGSQYDNDPYGKGSGFYNHETQDANLYFKDWDYDFIKIDYCGASVQGLDEKTQYTKIWNAIQATGKEGIRWNVCRWMFPGTWATEIAGSWRISHDILESFDTDRGIRGILDLNLYLSAYASPGHFNDMDMMQIGRLKNDGTMLFTEEEEKSHFGLWSIMCSPLMIGSDLRLLPESTRKIITNKSIIALNQDVLGLQAQVVSREGKRYVLAKQIEEANGKIRAVALFNCETSPRVMRINFSDIQLGGKVTVTDLWEEEVVGEYEDYYEITVPSHSTAMLRLEGEQSFDKTIYEGEDAFMNLFKAGDLQKANEARFEKAIGASGGYKMAKLGNSAENWAEFRNVYSTQGGTFKLKVFYYSEGDRNLTVTVNDTPYQLEGLNSGNMYSRGRKSIEITLNPGNNVIRLSNNTGWAPDVDKIELLAPDAPDDDDIVDVVEVDPVIINNPKFPTLSTADDTDETWYYIQFRNEGGVLQDMGDGLNIETKQKILNLDNQLWKVVETDGKYQLINKTGRKLSFASSYFQTSSSSSVNISILPTDGEFAPAWEIQREGASGCMNQFGGAGLDKELGEWSKNDRNNPLQFIAAEKILNYLPIISTEGNETWYYIQFISSGGFLQDMGADADLTTQSAEEDSDVQLWKVTKVQDAYQLTNKAGNVISFGEDNFYKASASNPASFQFIFTENTKYAPGLEIQRLGATGCMNQYGGSAIGNRISEWNAADDNNPVLFVLPSDMVFNFPIISTEGNEKWYYIQFKNGNGVLQDMGDNQDLLTKKLSETETAQHWKVISVGDGEFQYQFVNKSGRAITHVSSSETDDGLYQATSNQATYTTFNIVATGNTSYASAWELHREGSGRHMNQYKGAGMDRKISEWNKNDNGNPLEFVAVEEGQVVEAVMPKISSADSSNESWYYINFIDSREGTKAMLEDMGADQPVMTKDYVESRTAQLWKVIDSPAPAGEYKYQFVSATGRSIGWNDGRYIACDTPINLRFNELPPHWAIEREGAENGLGMTQMGLGPDREIKDDFYSAVGNGKLVFEEGVNLGTGVPEMETEKGYIYVQGKCIVISGIDVSNVTVYSVSGQMVSSQKHTSTVYLPSTGYFIVSVESVSGITKRYPVVVE